MPSSKPCKLKTRYVLVYFRFAVNRDQFETDIMRPLS
jgi:hypothetical protein